MVTLNRIYYETRYELCIETDITLGTYRVRVLGDDWTANRCNRLIEHIQWLVTENGLEFINGAGRTALLKIKQATGGKDMFVKDVIEVEGTEGGITGMPCSK